jgi:hypothetical protein
VKNNASGDPVMFEALKLPFDFLPYVNRGPEKVPDPQQKNGLR